MLTTFRVLTIFTMLISSYVNSKSLNGCNLFNDEETANQYLGKRAVQFYRTNMKDFHQVILCEKAFIDKRVADEVYNFENPENKLSNSDYQYNSNEAFAVGKKLFEKGYRNKRIVDLYKLSADQGNALAQSELGTILKHEDLGFETNTKEAMHYNKMAAENGVVNSQYALAVQYWMGDSGKAELELAKYWFEQSGQKGLCLSYNYIVRILVSFEKRKEQDELVVKYRKKYEDCTKK